ncbi:MAG: HlyC/CorC family transporter [Methanophagales archaeon]|nr:HlyC/CorC family transporter [Methanophagales archaeon]
MSWLIAKLLLLFVLLLLSGFFSGSETALIGIGKIRARALLKRGVKGAEAVDELVREPEAMLTTVLIGNNIVNIAAAAIATSIAIDLFGNYGVAIATGVMTLLILTFAEIMPKTIAVHHAERISIMVSKPMKILAFVFQPFIKVTSLITAAFERLLGIKLHRKRLMTAEEVETILDIGEEEGAIEEDEKEMMMGVLKLDEIVVKHVMTPKEEMVCLEVNQTVDSAVELIKRSGYSRIPVFKGSKDNFVGILYAKDLLIKANTNKSKGNISLKEMMKPPHFVPETKRVDDLLEEFQRGKFHIAIVVDAERITKGLVSLEDLLEVIVGSIYDEYDVIKIKKIKKGKAIA